MMNDARHLICLLVILLTTASLARSDPARVVVLANGNVAESIALAEHYMTAREIPQANLCVLDLPTGEQMSRHDYVRRLRDPLLAFLRERGLIEQEARPANDVEFHETPWITTGTEMDYLVSMYGVPLRVGDTRFRIATRITDRLGHPRFKNMAAVDSELSLLLAQPYDIAGPASNPSFRQLGVSREISTNHFLVVATRLDGPSAEHVRRIIDDTLFAERYGWLGRMYFDARGLQGGAYYIGDYWIREAYERFARAGYETELNIEEAVWDDRFPMEHAVLYFGWYTEHVEGPFLRPDFKFQPGALAYHIHSGSAVSLRETDRYWTAPLLARGAAASMGAVSEPFLTFTPELKVFAERMAYGFPFGDAAYMAQSALSWQITFVGDPLFRPFRYSLAEQIEHLRQDNRPEIEWAHIRHANLLILQSRFNIALGYLRAALRERESLVIREKLGDLYALNDLILEAGREYERVIQNTESPYTAARVGKRWMTILRAIGQQEQAERLQAQLNREWQEHPAMRWLDGGETPHVD